jgi:PBP1b-binding outer membrane lipoprotein LpoB
MYKLGALCLALSLLFTGCGGGEGTGETSPANAETPPTQDLSNIKTTLNGIAESGVIDSSFFGIPESLEQAGKPELAEEAKKLGTLKSPSQIKAAAKKLADKL